MGHNPEPYKTLDELIEQANTDKADAGESTMSDGCVFGCRKYFGNETRHHPDCQFYPESFGNNILGSPKHFGVQSSCVAGGEK